MEHFPAEIPERLLVVPDHPPRGEHVVPDGARPAVLVLAPPEMLQQAEVLERLGRR